MGINLDAQRRRAQFRLTSFMRRRESVWLARVLAHREYRSFLVKPSTDIVIDGYFRSSNTFSVEAFSSVNAGAQVAHHLHSPFQFVRAARYGVPAMLLVRNPVDAIASELVRSPEKSAEQCLRNWLFFYRRLHELRTSFVVATFDQVTTNFASTIQRVNAAFGTGFESYVNSDATDVATFAAVDAYFRSGKGQLFTPEQFDKVVGRPNNERLDLLEVTREEVLTQDPSALGEALESYQTYVLLAGD